MADNTVSPNMGLPVPNVGVSIGPQWAIDINNCLNTIDVHDHGPGRGVQITPSGILINSLLAFNDNTAGGLQAAQFTAQTSSALLAALYVKGVDLYYNDGSGNVVRLTQFGSVSGVSGTITGLVSPASATYVAGSQTFVWQANAGVPASMDNGSIIIRSLSSPYAGITLTTPTSIAAAYNLTLPSTTPASQSFMTMDSSGNVSAPWTVDGTTIAIISNQLKVQGPNLPNFDREHCFELNSIYGNLAFPANTLDGVFIAPYALTITSVWIYSGTAGSAGTTEYDLKVATTSGGSYTSILTTTGKITSAAAAGVWTDSNAIIGAQTGVTKPVVATTSIAAGSAIRFDLLQGMTGGGDAHIRIWFKQQ